MTGHILITKKRKDEASMKMIFLFNHVGKNRWEIVKVFFLFLHQNKKEIHEKGLGIWLKKYFFSFLIQIIIFYKKISTLNTFFFCIQETMFMSKKQYKNKKRYLSKKRFFFQNLKRCIYINFINLYFHSYKIK